MTELLKNLIDSTSFLQNCWFLFLTFIGATITQLLSFKLGPIGSTTFLKMWFQDKSNNWYARTNCVILVFIGTFFSFIVLEPNTAKSSFCAGLTWCGALQSFAQTQYSSSHD